MTYAKQNIIDATASGDSVKTAVMKNDSNIDDLFSAANDLDSQTHPNLTNGGNADGLHKHPSLVNVKADWNATTGDAQILHKPTLAPSDAQKNVQSDWNASAGDAFIKNKPSLAPSNAEKNVQADWTAGSGDAAILHKPAVITSVERGKLNKITVTQNINLNTIKADVATNKAKHSYPTADAAKVGMLSLSGSANLIATTPINLDALAAQGSSYPQADAAKVGFLTVTQPVNLDTMESHIALNDAHRAQAHAPANAEKNVNADWTATTGDGKILHKPALAPSNANKNVQADWTAGSGDAHILHKPTTITTAEKAKLGHIAITQAVNLDTMENHVANNTAKRTYPSADQSKVAALGNISPHNFTVSTGAPSGGSNGDVHYRV